MRDTGYLCKYIDLREVLGKMAKITLDIDYSIFNDAYLEAMYPKNKARYTVLYGGAGSGKSVFTVQNLIIKLLMSKRKLLVIRKKASTIEDSVFSEYKQQIENFSLTEHVKIKKTTREITFPNGSVIIFKGLDDSEKIKSIQGISDIMIEEATEITADDFSQLNLRLRGGNSLKDPQIYVLFNPVSKDNWVYGYFFKNFPLEMKEQLKIVKTTYLDNKFLDSNFKNSLMLYKDTNPLYYDIYVLGNWGNLGEKIFNNWEVQDKVDIKGVLSREGNDLYDLYGLDFGFIDPTAFLRVLVDETSKELYILDEIYQSRLTYNDIYSLIEEKGYKKKEIYADSADKMGIEQLKGMGIENIKSVKKPRIKDSIKDLFDYKIYIQSNCENTIREFENYAYKEVEKNGKKVKLEEPQDTDNHTIDALRYAMSVLSKKKNSGGIALLDY